VDIQEYNRLCDLIKEGQKAGQIISDRCNTIVRTIHPQCDWWDFSNGNDETDGFFDPVAFDTEVPFVGASKSGHNFSEKIIIDSANEWDLSYSFPTYWIYDEDWEKKYQEGLLKYKQVQLAKKIKQEQKKKENTQFKKGLVKSAIQKLTPQEVKAIKETFSLKK